jgi:hypothetical protein
MVREDYPCCISCPEKMKWVTFDSSTSLLVFYCGCGEIVEVEIKLEDAEGLLSDSECTKGC